jgi:hypothetical protein
MRCEREIVWEIFLKKIGETIKKTWEENFGRDSEKKILKNSSLNSAVTCTFFSSFNKIYILHFFFNFSNVKGILSI